MTGVLFGLWGPERDTHLMPLLTGDNNIVDTARNMIALNPYLHRLWGKGIIGFEPVCALPKGVRLRFRWIGRVPVGIDDRMDLGSDPRQLLTMPGGLGSLDIRHFETGRPILDGEVVDITSDDPSALPDMELIKLQWDLSRIAALSGAAGAAEDPSWDPDPDDLLMGALAANW